MKHIRLSVALVCVTLALVSPFASPRGVTGQPASGAAPIRYSLTVDVDYEKAFLNVVQAVSYPNRSGSALSTILFHVPPIAFDAFTLLGASVGDVPVKETLNGTMLELPLKPALEPGTAVTVTLKWMGKLPMNNGRYGASEGVLVLGDWYPTVAVLQGGDWERHQYNPRGDAYFSDAADFDVTLTMVNAPSGVTVASSAPQASHKGNQWVFRSENTRDVAFGVSSRFQTSSRRVDKTTITMYYLPDSSDGARKCLEIAEQAMRWYGERIGPYPYPSLAIVQVPIGTKEHTAQEHAGLFFLRSDIVVPGAVGIYVAHELAHAWFFGQVGSDQIREPWLDEGLATAVSTEFYRSSYPKEYAEVWGVWGGTPEEFRNTAALNKDILSFDSGDAYFYNVYRQGATFFRQLREAMGDDAFWQGLEVYVKEFSNRIARPQDLLRILRDAAGETDLVSIYRRYLDYPYLKFGRLSVGVGGAEGARWDGMVSVPITVTADSPTYTLTVVLDSNVLTTTTSPVTVTVDTTTLSDGAHELTARADDGGINVAEAGRAFRVLRPTPTPPPTASLPAMPASVTATLAAASPSPTAAATATGLPPAAVTARQSAATVGGIALGLAAGVLVVAGAMARARRRR